MTTIAIVLGGFYLMQVAAKAGVALSTARRVYQGKACEVTTRVRLERAARELGLVPPPPASRFDAQPELGSTCLQIEAK